MRTEAEEAEIQARSIKRLSEAIHKLVEERRALKETKEKKRKTTKRRR